jgi:hypothetical protein
MITVKKIKMRTEKTKIATFIKWLNYPVFEIFKKDESGNYILYWRSWLKMWMLMLVAAKFMLMVFS